MTFWVREAVESDHACIYATWLRSHRHGTNMSARMTDKTYYSRHHDVIEQLLDKSVVLVATTNEEPDVILGWACYEQGVGNESCGLPPVIHYVYVKPSFRKCGIATKLLDGLDLAGAFYSHETFMLKIEKIQKKLATCQFDPYSSMSTRRRSYERKD